MSAMKNILFVDDELRVLEGIRDVLRKHRKRWNVELAHGGEVALRMLAERPYDVVVTDLRMPIVDGFAVLEHLKEEYPKTVRLVLSGDPQRETVMKLVPQAHRALLKPCPAEVLQQAIESACALGALLADDELRRMVGRIGDLPPMPQTYARLTRVLGGEDASLSAISEVVESDVALAAKMLQLANSALFGVPRPVASVSDAIGFLGLELLRTVALSEGAFGRREVPVARRAEIAKLQEHSVLVARTAVELADNPAIRRDVFAAGLLHDVGRLVMALEDPGPPDSSSMVLRRESIQAPAHALVGAYLLGLWGVPAPIIEAVALHHNPPADGSAPLASLVAKAEALIERVAEQGAISELQS